MDSDLKKMEMKRANREQIYQLAIVALVAFVVIAIYYHREKLLPGYHGAADPSLANPAPLSLSMGMFGVPAKEKAVARPKNMFPIINKPFAAPQKETAEGYPKNTYPIINKPFGAAKFVGNAISEGYMCPMFNDKYAWPHTWIG